MLTVFVVSGKGTERGNKKKQTLPIKLPSGTAGLCFTKERKFGIFFFFLVAILLEEFVTWQIS